jgi:mRNA-degrading endonuclease toxin of MazEF toxin-antitoxin module
MVSRGQIVVVDFAVAGMPRKVRPVLVVQADHYNRKMTNSVVAMITTNLSHAREPYFEWPHGPMLLPLVDAWLNTMNELASNVNVPRL